MFSRLIIATDLSPASFAVLNCLGGLKALGAKQCLLLQCLSLQAEITRSIGERNAHLVVMGSQGRGFVKELFLGSVSHNVARHSDAAVLLIPAKR
jgi:hypothetical protein